MTTAMALADTTWQADALDVLEGLAKTGRLFDAHALTLAGLREPPHPNHYGALFSAAQARGLVEHAGWHRSPRRSRNGGVCSLWCGTPDTGRFGVPATPATGRFETPRETT